MVIIEDPSQKVSQYNFIARIITITIKQTIITVITNYTLEFINKDSSSLLIVAI